MTSISSIPATFKRFWGTYNDSQANGSRLPTPLTSSASSEEKAEEAEVATSLMVSGPYNSSSFAFSSSFSVPSGSPSTSQTRRQQHNDIRTGDRTRAERAARSSRPSVAMPSSSARKPDISSCEIESSQEQSQEQSQDSRALRRTLSTISNASTVLIDPTIEQCEARLDRHGIKHFDYGSQPPLSIIPELFDQYEGLAEFEYKLNQIPRANPITGKVLRRLLECGWVSMEEVQQRCNAMDMEELRKYDQSWRYPYDLRFPSDTPPSNTRDKLLIMLDKRWLYQRVDKAKDDLRKQREGDKEASKTFHEQWIEEQRARRQADAKGKRRFEGEQGGAEVEKGSGSPKRVRSNDLPALPSNQEPKRKPRKVIKVWSDEYWMNFERKHGLEPTGPEKQYPAPRSAYDPEIYPEAASVIRSQGRHEQPFERQGPTPLGRVDTPPLRSDTPPLDEPSQSQPFQPRKPVPLVHPKKAKGLQRGGLSRQQTLMSF